MTCLTDTRDRLLAYADGLGLPTAEGLSLALAAIEGAPGLPAAMNNLFALLRAKGASIEGPAAPLCATPPINRQSMIAEKKPNARI